jgi:hypothetical protein
MAEKKTKKVVSPSRERPEMPLPVGRPAASRHRNAILYGDSGSGKTWLMGTALECEETSPVLFIDVDSGMATLEGKDIDVMRPRSWKDIQKIYEFLLNDNTYYKCVVIDSLSEVQRKFSMGAILGEIAEDADHYNDLGSTPIPTRQDWMKTSDQMRKLIRAFRDLAYLPDESRRVHVFMIALEKYDEKKHLVCPQLPGALGIECGAFVDLLARLSRQNATEKGEDGLETVGVHRYLLTDDYINEDGTRYMAKDRSGKIGSIWDPTGSAIMEAYSS